MKKITLLFCALAVVALSLGACNKDKVGKADDLHGTWYVVKATGWYEDDEEGGKVNVNETLSTTSNYQWYWTFNSNGTGKEREVDKEEDWDDTEEFTWTFDKSSKTLTLTYGGEYKDTYAVKNLSSSSLTVEQSGNDYFTKLEFKKM